MAGVLDVSKPKWSPATVLEIATATGHKRVKMRQPEAYEQRLFVKRWRLDPRTRDLPASAIPSGGKRDVKTAMWMKADGLERGLPDWMLWHRGGGYAEFVGLALEFKAPGTGRVSADQARWHGLLREQGWAVEVVTSASTAWQTACEYLNLPP